MRTSNSLKTILGLHNLAVKHECNLPLYLAVKEDLAVQDLECAAFISASNVILNPGVVGIDAMDRTNFLSPNYIKDISMMPSLISISLSIGDSDQDPIDDSDII